MIRFSKREDYSIVIIGTLAKAYNKRLVPLSEIAKEYAVSALFLRNLANDLREAGIIQAIEGRNGGYYLCKDPTILTIGEILAAISGKEVIDLVAYKAMCTNTYCFAGEIWYELNKEYIEKIYNLSIHDFLNSNPHVNS